MPSAFAFALAASLVALPAAAAEKCWVSYKEFEDNVKHLDTEACPGGQPSAERGFCRLGIEGEHVIVFVFEDRAGDKCLTRIDRLRFADFVARFGVTFRAP
ncbi:MAG: hypothetical protein NZ523_04295 [Elioraea sp.]|nr:hypothetical protein [Elioraea sp.]MDW8445641.1 hypothetical protein [Acetobacteraceae bacterium]